jgi:lipopolysaccharide export system permease protein
MIRVNKLSILLLRSYLGPFVVTFLVAMFIFEMQFIWLYVDDLMGKGLEPGVIFKLLVYASARIVNMALPLAILMSSIMTFGSLSENNELTAMKSSGASLFRIMRPLVVFTIALSMTSFLFANNVWPIANLKFRTLLYSIVQQRPALNLEGGVFYNGIEGISIRVMEKNQETGKLKDIVIYDHRGQERGNRTVIRAKQGTMNQTDDKRFLVLTLTDGVTYDEMVEERRKERKHPLVRGTFEEMVLRLDLSSFAFSGDNEEVFRNSYEMMTIPQLSDAIDSLEIRRDSVMYEGAMLGMQRLQQGGTAPTERVVNGPWYFDILSEAERSQAVSAAREATRRSKDHILRNIDEIESRDRYIRRHKVEWHRKFILGAACLVLFFIGAPLGAIIRKGGLGLPTVIALCLFIIYQLVTMAGEKMAKSGIIDVWMGMWMSTLLMFPLSIWLTWKASREAVLFDRDTYLRIFRIFDITRWMNRKAKAI